MSMPPYESYKDTGNEWIGSVPSEWKVRRADFVIKSRKLQISPADLANVNVYHYAIPTVQMTGAGAIEEGESIDSGKLIINEPQVLVSKLNPRKSTVTVAEPHVGDLTVASTEFVPLIPRDADIGYMFYVWKSQKVTDRLSSFVQSVTRSHQRCDPEDITKIPWAWPPLGEQRKIAGFLDRKTVEIDTLIDKKRRLLDLLAEKRTALITRAVTKGLDPDAPMKDSGIEWLGEIPEHWGTAQLKRTWHSADYGLSESIREESGVRVLRMSCIVDGRIDVDQSGMVEDVQEHLLLRKEDLLFNRTNSLDQIAKVGRVDFEPERPLSFASYLVRMRLNKLALTKYMTYLLNSSPFLRFARANAIPAIGQANLKPSRYGQIQIPLPDLEEQERIVCAIESDADATRLLEQRLVASVEALEEKRSALITNAVTGQIKVA